jgi:hypothetical protein
VSSSPAEPSGEPVELFLIGRTLRGTLGEAFRREAIARFESLHDGGVDGIGDGDGDGGADAPPPHSGLSRTVELTAVAVTRAGTVSVDAGIADPAFRSVTGSAPAPAPAGEGERVFEVAVEEIEGIRPVAGPSGVDRSRRVVVQVGPDLPGATLAFRVSVLLPE